MNQSFLPIPFEIPLLEVLQDYCSREFVLVRFSETMLTKSIIDASRPIRNLLKQYGIVDYDEIDDGRENKLFTETLVLTEDDVRLTKTSHYRPHAKPGKPGDPRFMPYGIKNLVNPNTLVFITVLDGRILIVPVTREVVTPSNLYKVFPRAGKLDETETRLLKTLSMCRGQWIKSVSPKVGAAKDVGDTVEAFLGMTPNNRGEADFEGLIELKAKRHGQATKDTLFAQVPDWKASPVTSARDMVLKYGYPDREYPGYKALFVDVWNSPNNQGLWLETSEDEQLLYQNHGAGEQLERTCLWHYEKLRDRLYEKHPRTLWLNAEEAEIGGEIHFRYGSDVELTRRPLFSQFMLLIEQGVVVYNWRARFEEEGRGRRDRGHPFRIIPKMRSKLFGESIKLDLPSF